MDQQQQQPNNSPDAEAFAQVWKRVSPDPDSSPIQCGRASDQASDAPTLALGPEALEWGGFLRTQIVWELTRWRTYQRLSRPAGTATAQQLADAALNRAKQIAATLFILTGVWYLPWNQATPRNWKTHREGYRLLFQGAQRAELRYRSAVQTTSDPILSDLFRALATESAREQRQLLGLLAR